MLIVTTSWLRRLIRRSIFKVHLCRIDSNLISDNKEEIRLFLVIRNEATRLPYLFNYYLSLGVSRFFVVDNYSTDGSIDFLKSQPNTHIFQTKDRYIKQAYWIDALLCRYGIGHWCLVVDADEFLVYPNQEMLTLKKLCTFLERRNFNALRCFLLDMYPDKPLSVVKYIKGDNPLRIASYFDLDFDTFKGPLYFGGVRKRVFGVNPCLNKIPLFKFEPYMFLTTGAHFLSTRRNFLDGKKIFIADIQGALFHFKFLDDFDKKIAEYLRSGKDNFIGSAYFEYMTYGNKIKENPALSLYYPGSIRYTNNNQLLKLGILKSSADLDNFVKKGNFVC